MKTHNKINNTAEKKLSTANEELINQNSNQIKTKRMKIVIIMNTLMTMRLTSLKNVRVESAASIGRPRERK